MDRVPLQQQSHSDKCHYGAQTGESERRKYPSNVDLRRSKIKLHKLVKKVAQIRETSKVSRCQKQETILS